MSKKVLITATVQSHICQFHKPLVEVLHAHGYEVHVAARDNLAEKNGLKLDFVEKIFDVPFARSPKSKDNITAYKQLKKIIDKGGYDVIHCNTPMGGIVTRLAARDARKKGTMVFYTAHGFHFYKGAPLLNWLIYYPIEKSLSYITDGLITINFEDYNTARKRFHCLVYHIHGAGVDEKRYKNVDDETAKAIRKKYLFSEDDFIILCVGELLPNKNQMMLIKAVEKLVPQYPSIKVLIAGNGLQKEELQKYIDDNGLCKNVVLLGYCTNLEEYQAMVDIGVSCSIREGLGFNIIEAMLSENPVIATKNRGHNELIADGENGYLVDIGDINGLSDLIEKMLKEPELCNNLGKHGAEFAVKYAAISVKKELEEIYGLH